MTDCNGATIGVGDVVEVVDERSGNRGKGWATVREVVQSGPVPECRVESRSFSWFGWYLGNQLRLVRRKEKA